MNGKDDSRKQNAEVDTPNPGDEAAGPAEPVGTGTGDDAGAAAVHAKHRPGAGTSRNGRLSPLMGGLSRVSTMAATLLLWCLAGFAGGAVVFLYLSETLSDEIAVIASGGAGRDARIEDLALRLESIEQSTPTDTASHEGLGKLTQDFVALEDGLTGEISGLASRLSGQQDRLSAIDERIVAMEASLSDSVETPGAAELPAAIVDQLQSFEVESQNLAQTVALGLEKQDEQLTALEDATTENRRVAADAAAAITALEELNQDLEQRLTESMTRIEELALDDALNTGPVANAGQTDNALVPPSDISLRRMSSSTSREAAELTREIEGLRVRNAELENRVMRLAEKIESESLQLAGLREALATLQTDQSRIAESVFAVHTASSDGGALRDEMTEMHSRVESLSNELSRTMEQVGEIAVLSERLRTGDEPAFADLQEQVGVLSSRLEALERETVTMIEQEVGGKLDERLQGLQAEIRSAADDAAEKSLLFRLLAAVEAGQPFTGLLREAQSFDPPTRALLEQHAESGVPSVQTLLDSFSVHAREALRTIQAPDQSGGGVGSFVRSLVTVRPLTPQEGDEPEALLSRAEEALRQERMEDALAILGGLPESQRLAMDAWIDSARTRLTVVDAVRDAI